MMHAITHLNPVVGVDVHIIQPPGPVPPVPVPHPYIGIVFDPADYVPIIGSTINIHGLPRSIAGTAGKTVPSHIPIGGVFVKPPGNEDENFMGSSTVAFDGDAATYAFLPALECQDVGMPAPPRLGPKKKTKMKSLLLPSGIVMPIPAGPPVLIGGPPTISLMAIGMKFAMAGLGRGLARVAKSKAFQRAMGAFKKARQKAFRNMKPGFLKCTILKAEPVDVVTGEVVLDQQDYSIPGRIPLEWNRHYSSRSERMGVCGYGWETPADAHLELEDDGSVTFHDGTGAPTFFPTLPVEAPVMDPVDGGMLYRMQDFYAVRLKGGLTYYFPVPKEPAGEALVQHVMDLCENSLTFVRDANGLKEIVESAGRRIEVSSEGGLIRRMRLRHPDDPNPHPLLRFEYSMDGDLLAVHDALDNPYRFAYREHRLVQHTNRVGLSFYYDYDDYTPDGRCLHSWGDGGLYDYHFTYKDLEGRTEFSDSLGHPWSVTYDHRYLITEERDPLGGKTLYEYDAVGRTTAVVDPDGHRTEYLYDERGNLLKLTRPDGHTIVSEFDERSRATSITDPNGAVWRQEWGARGLLARQTSPLGVLFCYEYDDSGQLVAFTNPREARTELSFDAVGNLTVLTNALGYRTLFAYDPLGNVIGKRDPLGRDTRYRYDAKSRLTDVRLPSGATIHCGYDVEGNLVRYVDENGAETRLEYVGVGEVARRIQADGHSVQYHYDAEERLIGVTNQRGELYQLRRDARGRLVEEIDYWGQPRRYQYSTCGYIKRSVDPLGRAIDYVTDSLGRILKKNLPDPDGGEKPFEETFAYDPNGNLVSCANRHIRVERSFDAEGRLLREAQGDDFVVENFYDGSGNRVERRSSLGNRVGFAFDALNRISRISINSAEGLAADRDAVGRILRETIGPGLSRYLTYDADDLVAEQRFEIGKNALFATCFRYDRTGNLSRRSDTDHGSSAYYYDPLGRVLESIDPCGHRHHYFTDAAGDRVLGRSGAPSEVAVESRADAQAGEPWWREGDCEGLRYRFDRAGNLVSRSEGAQSLNLTWDANQRLVRSEGGRVPTHYTYDPLGRRVLKRTGTLQTRFYWDGDAMVGEVVCCANQEREVPPAREYVYYPATLEPITLLVGRDDPEVLHYHNDPNGCPTRLTDRYGRVRWAASYAALGGISSLQSEKVPSSLRLQGQYHDEETGLHYNRNRYFDPVSGAFVSQDPLGLKVGPNLYGFAPNIFKWVDPLGLTYDEVKFNAASREHALGRHSPHQPPPTHGPGAGKKGTEFPKSWSDDEFISEAERMANDVSIPRIPVPVERGGVGWTKQAPVTINGETRTIRVIGEVPDPDIPGTGPGVITSAYPPWKNK